MGVWGQLPEMGSAGWQWLAEEGAGAGGAEPLGPVLAGLLGPTTGTPTGPAPRALSANCPEALGGVGAGLWTRAGQRDPGESSQRWTVGEQLEREGQRR